MIYCEEKQSELRCISCQIPFKLIHSLITYVMTSEQADWLALPGYHVTVYARTCVPCGISEPLTNFSTLLSFIIFTDWSQQYYKDPTSIYLCKSHVLIFCKRILPNLVLWWQSPSLYCGQYGPKMSMDKKNFLKMHTWYFDCCEVRREAVRSCSIHTCHQLDACRWWTQAVAHFKSDSSSEVRFMKIGHTKQCNDC